MLSHEKASQRRKRNEPKEVTRKHKLEIEEKDEDHGRKTKCLHAALEKKNLKHKEARHEWLEEKSNLVTKLNSMVEEIDALKQEKEETAKSVNSLTKQLFESQEYNCKMEELIPTWVDRFESALCDGAKTLIINRN